MASFAEQRKNMVESQVRTSDVTDRRIIAALLDVPREIFVPEAIRPLAYMDGSLRLIAGSVMGPERSIMEPRLFARLLDLANIQKADRVLDVGAGTGYSAAVLSRLAGHVIALEAEADLVSAAEKVFAELKPANVRVVKGGLAAGWAEAAPYDVIVLEGSVTEVPETLLNQLNEGGRLLAIENSRGHGRAVIWRRFGTSFDRRISFDASATALPGFDKSPAFQL